MAPDRLSTLLELFTTFMELCTLHGDLLRIPSLLPEGPLILLTEVSVVKLLLSWLIDPARISLNTLCEKVNPLLGVEPPPWEAQAPCKTPRTPTTHTFFNIYKHLFSDLWGCVGLAASSRCNNSSKIQTSNVYL